MATNGCANRNPTLIEYVKTVGVSKSDFGVAYGDVRPVVEFDMPKDENGNDALHTKGSPDSGVSVAVGNSLSTIRSGSLPLGVRRYVHDVGYDESPHQTERMGSIFVTVAQPEIPSRN